MENYNLENTITAVRSLTEMAYIAYSGFLNTGFDSEKAFILTRDFLRYALLRDKGD